MPLNVSTLCQGRTETPLGPRAKKLYGPPVMGAILVWKMGGGGFANLKPSNSKLVSLTFLAQPLPIIMQHVNRGQLKTFELE